MKTIHVVGARPQFIKMATVSRAVAEHNQKLGPGQQLRELIIHTGQHYDYEMSKVFFDELEIPTPDYNLGVGSGSCGEQTGEMLKRVERTLLDEQSDLVLVYGDTNSTLAGALAAVKLGIPVAHVEAGLRSYRKSMPEEINRVLTDHVSTILFCPTETSVKNLAAEGFANIASEGMLAPLSIGDLDLSCSLDDPLVINVGDVMFDSVLYNINFAEGRSSVLRCLGLGRREYCLATVHRAENTDDLERLARIFTALDSLAQSGLQVVCPLHPRTRKALSKLGAKKWHADLTLIEPVSYLDMLVLEEEAKLILTDSGGIQKEAYFMKVPCVTLRDETEWRELVDAGWNRLAESEPERIVEAAKAALADGGGKGDPKPYGDGHAAERIVRVLLWWQQARSQ